MQNIQINNEIEVVQKCTAKVKILSKVFLDDAKGFNYNFKLTEKFNPAEAGEFPYDTY